MIEVKFKNLAKKLIFMLDKKVYEYEDGVSSGASLWQVLSNQGLI